MMQDATFQVMFTFNISTFCLLTWVPFGGQVVKMHTYCTVGHRFDPWVENLKSAVPYSYTSVNVGQVKDPTHGVRVV